jgi:hypothetical protein
MSTFPCDICNMRKLTKVVYQSIFTPNDSEEKCEYSCSLYKVPCDKYAGRVCKSVKKYLMRNHEVI